MQSLSLSSGNGRRHSSGGLLSKDHRFRSHRRNLTSTDHLTLHHSPTITKISTPPSPHCQSIWAPLGNPISRRPKIGRQPCSVQCGNSSNSLDAGNSSSHCHANKSHCQPIWASLGKPISRRPKIGRQPCSVQCGNSSNSLNAGGNGSGKSFRGWVESIGEGLSTAFPLWVALGCLLGLKSPSSYNWVQPQWTIFGITLTMLGMGMTLTFDDLKSALSMPKELLAGFVLQYSVMPLSAYFVSRIMNLPSYYAAGLILVGCCPGGTASNIVTYIARGNVALSVLMTAASTLSAVVMTPFLTAKLAGTYVAVDAAGLLLSTLQVVLLPVLAGAFLNQYFKRLVKLVSPLMPPIAVATVAILCGKAIAQSSSAILVSGRQVILATALLHTSGFFFGYVLSRCLGIDVTSARTISIEVGMQNSVLGVVLASQHFGDPLTAVPCAVSSVCHSIFGSALAGIWRQMTPPREDQA